MDVNGTQFHLLTGQRDWSQVLPADSPLLFDRDSQSLEFRPLPARLPRRPSEPILTPHDRRGADRDRFGHFYWIDASQTAIRFLPSGTTTAGTAWSTADLEDRCPPLRDGGFGPVRPSHSAIQPTLRGLAVTTHHYLVVGTLDPAGLLIFDLHAGGLPEWRIWPESVAFAPFDMAAAPDGGVWILDRGPDPGASRFWRLDRYFCVQPTGSSAVLAPAVVDDFQPVGKGPTRGTPTREFPLGIELGLASPVEVLHPVAIESMPDGSVLILETDPNAKFSHVHWYRDGEHIAQVSLEGILGDDLVLGEGFSTVSNIKAHDFAFQPAADVRDGVYGELFLVGDDGNQAFALRFIDGRETLSPPGFDLLPIVRFLPLRRFSGKALVGTPHGVFYDFDEMWLPLAEQPRRRYPGEATVSGIIRDGKQPDTVWHRVLLDACLPNGASIEIASRASNQRELLNITPWQTEPAPVFRTSGSELPFVRPYGDREHLDEGAGTWDVLLQNARGRYLELRLTFRGNQRSTPRLRALRVYYPRFSYLAEYLPGIYSEDVESAGFLDRFLSNVEGLFTALEGEVETAQVLFDPRTSPPEFLDWLGGWLGAALDPSWDDVRRRLFLAHAVLLFRWRGTLGGLRAAVRLAIDPCPDEHIFDELRIGSGADFAGAGSAPRSNQSDRAPLPMSPGGDVGACGRTAGPEFSVRIVEHFLRREFPGVALGDPTRFDDATPTGGAAWQPAHGAGVLHQRFQNFLHTRYGGSVADLNAAWENPTDFAAFTDVRLFPVEPQHPVRAADWRQFVSGPIGFTYSIVTPSPQNIERFREYLQSRYRHTGRLNAAWQRTGADRVESFQEVALPLESEFPEAAQPLADWIEFVSTVLPIHQNAHRFTVLIPTNPAEDRSVWLRRLAQADQVVRQERPAHADFEVTPYWALFQVGSARLGLDTAIGEGSRFVSVVLGATALSAGALQGGHPWDVQDRRIVGRDSIWRDRRRTQP